MPISLRPVHLIFALFFSVNSLINAPAYAQNFLLPDTEQAAAEFETYLKAQWSTKGNNAKGWRSRADAAMKDNDPRAATGFYASAAVLDPDNADSWLQLARAYLAIQTQNYSEQYRFRNSATSAAYLAYKRAQNDSLKAAALATLGQSFAARSIWRPAIESYRASLALQDNADIRVIFDQMVAEHGFRMLDYTVDSDSATPRICVQFSEALAPGRIDFAKFVSLNGEDPAGVRAEGSQLCVDELLHGRRYTLRIREGLPSAVGEDLPKSVDLTIYVRDRKPAVRFTSNRYVLPRSGQQGVPVIAINTKSVKVELYRIGDRQLADEVLDGTFGQQVHGYEAQQLENNRGEKLWTGEMPVKTALNEEVTIAFPIDELLPDLKPGLYIMTGQPAEAANEYAERATQWFVVSDLGLMAMNGVDGVHGFVRSLSDAQAKQDVEVRLLARNNEVLATATTDENGYVRFDAGLARGKGGLSPALLVAREVNGDYGFLDLTRAAFDLSDRGVGGRQTPGPLDAMLFTERGVYRPGETVYLTALLRDQLGKAAHGVPLTLKILRPDYVEFRRELLQDGGDGGRSLSLTIPAAAMTGTWRVSAHADPDGAAIGEAAFLVEDYTPERLEMTLVPAAEVMTGEDGVEIAVNGRYLYGAPASNLVLEGEVTVSESKTGRKGYEAYTFGLDDENFSSQRQPLQDLPLTDEQGAATLLAKLPVLAQTTQPLQARIAVRMREPSGRVLAETVELPVRPAKPTIGVKPEFSGNHAGEGTGDKAFDIVVLDRDGNPAEMKELTWELVRLEQRFQWYNRDGRWDYETVTYVRKVANGTVDVDAGPARITVPAGYGRFRLEVTAAGNQALPASHSFYSGWYVAEGSETPDILDVALDKPAYKTGDVVQVKISPRMAGEAIVSIVSDRVIATKTVPVSESGAAVSFETDESWGPGAYVLAQLYRPMDSGAKRMPSRAIGVKWIGFDSADNTIGISLDLPEKQRPNRALTIPVQLAGLASGETAQVTIAAVDLGILNLTDYETPEPDTYYFGQRRLSMELRDLYGRLIDGMQGVRGTIRSGGGGVPFGLAMQGRPMNAEPLAFYSGVIQVGEDGKAEVSFNIPAFDGTLRVMAAAWSAGKLGHATKDVIIRDPLVIQGTPPKFLIVGDTSELHLSIRNVEGAEGDYELSALTDGVISIPEADATQSFALKPDERKDIALPLSGDAIGNASIEVLLSGPEGQVITRGYALQVKPAAPNVTRRSVQTLAANNGSLRVTADLVADLIPETARVTISAGPAASLDVPGLLLALDRYPLGCAEQTVSRALPLLYHNEIADSFGLAGDEGAKQRIQAAIGRLALLQDSSGSFGLWSPSGYDLWLTAYVTDFLTRAQEGGYRIRSTVLESALDRLKNAVNYAGEFESGGEELAYALYVLARSGRAVVGDLRYYTDEKLENFATPLAQAQLGAALAMYGDKDRAERAFSVALRSLQPEPEPKFSAYRSDFGTSLRDGAAMLTLVSETRTLADSKAELLDLVNRRRASKSGTSTQENAWLLLAAKALIDESRDLTIEVDGASQTSPVQRVIGAGDISDKPFVLKNLADRPIGATVIVSGASVTPEPAASAGFTIDRRVYTTSGEEVSLVNAKQNDRFVVVLKVSETEAKLGHIIVEDRLPAGFEIENPSLVKGSDISAFSWLGNPADPLHTSFRDDRFQAAFSEIRRDKSTPANFTMAYVMRAVTPGEYTHPGAYVEDMYRPERFARTEPGKVKIAR
ncbi:MAG: alpha-2-macroglobulin family protein [Hyphomicrobiales bacterium]|nr:alpha-2-macroglobulin family protein [Hyphomicrobiales bacterium]